MSQPFKIRQRRSAGLDVHWSSIPELLHRMPGGSGHWVLWQSSLGSTHILLMQAGLALGQEYMPPSAGRAWGEGALKGSHTGNPETPGPGHTLRRPCMVG